MTLTYADEAVQALLFRRDVEALLCADQVNNGDMVKAREHAQAMLAFDKQVSEMVGDEQ